MAPSVRWPSILAVALAAALVFQAPVGAAEPADPGFAAIVARDMPAVVNIAALTVLSPGRIDRRMGSGVVVRPDGYIVTNGHVVADATSVRVTLFDRRELDASIVGIDPDVDIAVLKVEGGPFPSLGFSDSSGTRPGDVVLVMGSPFGLAQSVTMGVVSATRRTLGGTVEDFEDFIQTDAVINRGNSGGALVNASGELVGITTAMIESGGGSNQGVGFAIPSKLAGAVFEEILAQGRPVRSFVGIAVQDVTSALASAFELTSIDGALIGDVAPGSPAAVAGIERGDVVVAFENRPVVSANALRLTISMMKPGTIVHLTVSRRGVARDVAVTLEAVPAFEGDASFNPGAHGTGSATNALQRVQVADLTSAIRRDLGIPPTTCGVLVTEVPEDSPAAIGGLEPYDIIEEIDRASIADVEAFGRTLKATNGRPLLLLVDRDETTFYIVVRPI